MPPHNLSVITTRSFNKETTTGMASMEETALLDGTSDASSGSMALHVVVLIVVGVVLIVAILLMPKGSLLNLASKLGFSSNKNRNEARPWFGWKSKTVALSATEKPEPTFVQRHLEMLRAWQKPTPPAQPPLPLYLARPDATHQPRRPTGMASKEWQERQLYQPNPMYDVKLTGASAKGPAYWKKYAEEMEARKPW